MEEQPDFKAIAAQLRKPDGEGGKVIAEKMKDGNAYLISMTIENLELKPESKILEIGFGGGSHVHQLFERTDNFSYTGLDYSELMVNDASSLNENYVTKGKAEFVLGNIHQTDFETDSFDEIFTVNTIYFWDERDKAIAELKRILKPNGRLLIGFRPKKVMDSLSEITMNGFREYTKEELIDFISSSGFKVESSEHRNEPEREFLGKKEAFEGICSVFKNG